MQDTNIVGQVLCMLLDGSDITMHGPDGQKYIAKNRWKMGIGSPRLDMLRLVSKNFHLFLRSAASSSSPTMNLSSLRMYRTRTSEKYTPYDTREVVCRNFPFLRPSSLVYIDSIGNGFDKDGVPIGLPSPEFLSKTETLVIGSLDGLISLPGGVGGGKIVLPPSVEKLEIKSMGHTGLLNLKVIDILFTDAQRRCVGVDWLEVLPMSNVGGVKELVIGSPMPLWMQRPRVSGVMEFHMDPVLERNVNLSPENVDRLSMAVIVSKLFKDKPELLQVGPNGGVPVELLCNGGSSKQGYILNRDLGFLYLSQLDFCGLHKLTLRAHACIGVPVLYACRRPGGMEMRMHENPEIHNIIAKGVMEDIDHMIPGECFPWYMAVINMVARSPNLEEVVYTHVREVSCFATLSLSLSGPVYISLDRTLHEFHLRSLYRFSRESGNDAV